MKTRALTLRKNGAFTLIELLIVVIIVGILAAAAVPMYIGQTRRARLTEATAGLGAIRAQQGVWFSEHGAYTATLSDLGLNFSNNSYFNDAAFTVTVDAARGFIATADGDESGAPRSVDVSGLAVRMDAAGNVINRAEDGSWPAWPVVGGEVEE